MEDLSSIRERIDVIDRQLADLFVQRMGCSAAVAEYKRAVGMPVLDRGREREKLASFAALVPEEYRDYARLLLSLIMELSRASQNRMLGAGQDVAERVREAAASTPALFPQEAQVACQGVDGAYSHIAAERLFRRPTISHLESFEGVFEAVEQGRCRYGVVPVENSTAGTVNQVYDLMMRHEFSIVRTLRLKVDHSLLARRGATIEGIREVYSHQQAIDQCSQFLASLPDVEVHVCENTAVAAKLVAESGRDDVAALSSRACAELYGLEQLARSVQNSGANFTRFACISKDLEVYPGADRTSLMLVTKDEPGSLYQVLSRFYALDVNLVKLESRPLPNTDFEFMFYFDLQCPVAAPEFATLLGSLGDVCQEFRYLGSYAETV